MNSVDSLIVETSDVDAATTFYDALGVSDRVTVRHSSVPADGFRGWTGSLVVSQPGTVDAFVSAARGAGARTLVAPKKGFWGYGGVVQAPDGAIWKVATSSKKDTVPVALQFDELVLLLGVEDVKASKQFYVDQGLEVARSFGRKYVEFAAAEKSVKVALYGRRALAKDAGIDPSGSGSHRIAIGNSAGSFTDPDGFDWETTHI